MAGTLTWVGMDVHARSTHAPAIDLISGEIQRMRFDRGVEAPVAWLSELAGPVYACYEAGPTGFGLFRAATGGDQDGCGRAWEDATRAVGQGED
jgi:transposase